MTITIHWASGSCPSWRVLFALELKGLAYESRLLEISKQQHKSAEMLALNPRGKVPVLVDGDTALYESMAIIAYLDARYPARPVLGRDPEQTGRIWRTWSEAVCYLEPAVDRLCIPIYRGLAAEQADAVRAAARDVTAELAPFEAQLARTAWLAGDEPTAADGAFVPQIGHVMRALGKPLARDLDLELAPLGARFPAFAAWWDRCQALPNFARTTPPHWRV
jgi:glutathione S-transferase